MSSDKKYTWIKIADSINELPFEANNLCEILVNGKLICLNKKEDSIHACASKCPHAGGSFVNGCVDALGNIVCPLHRYKFSLTTGRNTSGEGYFLKTYPIKQDERGIYVGFEEKKGIF